MAVEFSIGKASIKLNWEESFRKYQNFTDVGKYLLIVNDLDCSEFSQVLKQFGHSNDFTQFGCTATAKLNRKGEVIIGRNMDVEISQNPAVVTGITGGRYSAVSFFYGGVNSKYRYSQLEEYDNDPDRVRKNALSGTDAMNEAGLYIEMNMREMDDSLNLYCTGTNPGKERACLICAPTLIAANCATVPEALEFLKNSYDWYTLTFHDNTTDTILKWNLALMLGDAQGNFGLVEFVHNRILYTPYANGQGNYYIHPDIAEYANFGAGYGRLSAALEGLPGCETDWDMLHNMEQAMWRREILSPGCLGYSDVETSLQIRRELTQEELQKLMDEKMIPHQAAAKEFYAGNEQALRDDGSIWTTGFNFGVNSSQKHLILRLWESDNAILECQW